MTNQPTNQQTKANQMCSATVTIARSGRALDALDALEARRLTLADIPESKDARERWADHRGREGMTSTRGVRFTTEPDANSKLVKGVRPVVSVSLAPAVSSGHDICPARGACTAPCVGSDLVGRASFHAPIMIARAVRTRFVLSDPAAALALVMAETERETYRRQGGHVIGRQRVAQRLNAFSDIAWERVAPFLFSLPFVDPYDYTKRADRLPTDRYRLIYSGHERDTREQLAAKLAMGPLAIVIDAPRHQLPNTIAGHPVTDGDLDDYRNASAPVGHLVGLALKGTGKAKHHARRTGFAMTPTEWAERLAQ